MKLLLTGSGGMVGHNLLENNYIGSHDVFHPRASELNLLNFNDVVTFLKNTRPDMIIHCAGKVGGIHANMKDKYGFFTDNIAMGFNIVKAAKEEGIKKFINISSSCIYPSECPSPLKEEYIFSGKPDAANEGYALAKLTIEQMCEYISTEYPDFQYKSLVLCNLYGRWDKFDDNRSHMIPSVIKKIHEAVKSGIQEVEIWGDGTARREFLYAEDLAACIARIIEEFDEVPQVMNVGLGYDYSINEYYDAVKKVLGYNGVFIHDIAKPVGIKQKLLDTTRQIRFGWEPIISLEEGIKRTYKFFIDFYVDKSKIKDSYGG
jgi:GDP-L-fucose synthase